MFVMNYTVHIFEKMIFLLKSPVSKGRSYPISVSMVFLPIVVDMSIIMSVQNLEFCREKLS